MVGPGHAVSGGSGRGRVGEIQRARIIGAMGELVRERGPGAVTVAHVVARSGVSRRTFYELFTDREDCFLAAFDIAIARAAETVGRRAYEAAGKWRERVRAGLQAALCFLDAEPELGYLCVVGALGGGDRALERRTLVVRRLVDVVHEGRLESKAARRPRAPGGGGPGRRGARGDPHTAGRAGRAEGGGGSPGAARSCRLLRRKPTPRGPPSRCSRS